MVSSMVSSAMTAIMLEAGTTTATKSFDIISFLKNATGYLKEIGNYLMILGGVILIIVAVVQIIKGLAGGGRGQTNWVMTIGALLVGGLLVFGGWNMATSVASLGAGTIEQVASGNYEQTVGADGDTNAVGFGATTQ